MTTTNNNNNNINISTKPKKIRSSYILFCMDYRQQVINNNPDFTNRQILSKLGSMWRDIKSTEEQQKYIEKSNLEKSRYLTEKKDYESKTEAKEAKETKETLKRPRSSYILFCMDYRQQVINENPAIKNREILSKLGSMWRDIKSTQEQQKYIEKSNNEKSKYLTEKKV